MGGKVKIEQKPVDYKTLKRAISYMYRPYLVLDSNRKKHKQDSLATCNIYATIGDANIEWTFDDIKKFLFIFSPIEYLLPRFLFTVVK